MSSSLLDHVIIGKESTYNTAVVPSVQIPVAREGGITTDPSAESKSELRSTQAQTNVILQGVRKNEGSYKMDLFHELAGYVFLSALGSVTSAVKGGESVVYEHDFAEALTKQSYTIEQKFGSLTRRFSGAVFNVFKLIAEAGQAGISLETEVLAAANVSASPVTPVAPTSGRFVFDNLSIQIASVVFDQITKIELEHNSGLALIPTLNGSKDADTLVNNGSVVKINIEAILDSSVAAKYQEMLDNTTQRIDLDVVGSETIGTASNPTLNVGLPNCKIITGELAQVGEGAALLPITLESYSETGSHYDEFKLTNLTASY